MEPKSIKNPLKIHPKIEVRKRTVQNREKSRPGAPKGRKCRCGPTAGLAILSRWVPTNQQKERGLYSRDPILFLLFHFILYPPTPPGSTGCESLSVSPHCPPILGFWRPVPRGRGRVLRIWLACFRHRTPKSQEKPAKAHTKIAAGAKKPRKAEKSQQKHIQKSPRTPKTKEK